MSLTEAHAVFVAAHETALNDLVTAVCLARPHLLHYGSPAFVPSSSTSATQMAPIAFPGSPGLQWSVQLGVPHLDLYDEDSPLPSELSLGPGQFSLSTTVVLCVDCVDARRPEGDTKTHGNDHPAGKNGEKNDQPRGDKPVPWPDDRDNWGKARNPMCCKLGVYGVGHLVSAWANGQPAIGFALDGLELVDVQPQDVESVLECLLSMILRSVLATLSIPVPAFEVGAFDLNPTEGPLIDIDRVLARGDLV